MTRGEYDALPPQQREFYDRLVREGRIKIVPDRAPPGDKLGDGHRSGRKQPEEKPDPIERMKGRSVRARLVDGSNLEGTLTEISKFEVVVATEGRDLVVLKHALITLEEILGPQPAAPPADVKGSVTPP